MEGGRCTGQWIMGTEHWTLDTKVDIGREMDGRWKSHKVSSTVVLPMYPVRPGCSGAPPKRLAATNLARGDPEPQTSVSERVRMARPGGIVWIVPALYSVGCT